MYFGLVHPEIYTIKQNSQTIIDEFDSSGYIVIQLDLEAIVAVIIWKEFAVLFRQEHLKCRKLFPHSYYSYNDQINHKTFIK
jgi:hypothetical protein